MWSLLNLSLTKLSPKFKHRVYASRGINCLCCNWYAKIGVSDFPRGPTVKRVAEYRRAAARLILQADNIMAAMQILPLKSWSATFKNRPRRDLIFEVKLPLESTSLVALRRPIR